MLSLFKSYLFLILCLSSAAHSQTPPKPYQPPDPSSGYSNATGADAAKQQWSNLLGNLIWFYEAQRSGKLPSSNRVSWRNDSGLQDVGVDGADLTGGYYDAGDYIKATIPLSYTLFTVCWGANIFGRGYDAANQTAHLDEMLRWGLDWLMKANPNPSTLYVQVGDTNIDNNYWGGDLNFPNPRPAFQVNRTHTGTDVVALTSGAFSACSLLYSGFSLSPNNTIPASLVNGTYAAQLLDHGAQLWSLAQQTPLSIHSASVSNVVWAYPGYTFEDDLVMAEIMVAAALAASNSTGASPTGRTPQQHLDTAYAMYNTYRLQAAKQDVVFNWASRTPALPLLFAEVASLGNGALRAPNDLAFWQAECEVYFERVAGGKGRGFLTKSGLLWYNGDSDLASLSPAMNTAMLMFMYAPLATSADRRSTYLGFAQDQWDYALGNNRMNVPYIVGVNPNSPKRPHDAKSHGGTNDKAINTDPQEAVHILYGAVIGGPDKGDKYWDIRTDWPQTEVALDYNAPLLTLAAYSLMYASDTPPFYTSLAPGAYESVRPDGTPCDVVFPCTGPKFGLSTGQKIGMAVGIVVPGLVILCLSVWLVHRWRQSKAKKG